MVKSMVLIFLVVSIAMSVSVRPVSAAAAVQMPPVSADGRFSGFDAISHIQQHHASLAKQAEHISHWAGYYTVNPILLTHLAKASASQQAMTPGRIRDLAATLGAMTGRAGNNEGRLTNASRDWAGELSAAFSLDADVAVAVLERTAEETGAAGLLAEPGTVSDSPPALDLPFGRPQAWEFSGVHTWTGDDDGSAMSSIDFASDWSQRWGDDTSGDWVAAANDGVITVYSSCFVGVRHDNGWSTRYYHMDNLQVSTGQRVLAGDLLGNYAGTVEQALCAGGHSSGPHVHFTLMKDSHHFSLRDIALSGYLIHPGDRSYEIARDRMWLEKRGTRFYAFDLAISQQEGDNIIDYRYNGMWFSFDHNGHGLNVEITEFPGQDTSRKAVFVVLYTYDDDGLANYYVGNRDFQRWRVDESMTIDMLQTAGGDFSSLFPIDFENPADVKPAGQVELWFPDCLNAQVDFSLDERSSGLETSHSLEMIKLIGVPDHVCAAASIPLQ